MRRLLLLTLLAVMLSLGTREDDAGAFALCTPAAPSVSPVPADGTTGVPANARVVFEHKSAQVDASSTEVLADGIPVAGTFAIVGYPQILTPAWTEFRPDAPFAAGAVVTVVVGTSSGLFVEHPSSFTVGSASDTVAPEGGKRLDVDEFSPGEFWGYEVTFEPASDAEGPAWLQATVVTEEPGEAPSTATRLIDGSTYVVDGQDTSCSMWVAKGTKVSMTVAPVDLAGNVGEVRSSSFVVGEDGGGFCAIGGVGGRPSFAWALLLALGYRRK